MKKLVFIICILISLTGCYVNHKLAVSKNVRIIDKAVIVVDSTQDSKYIHYGSCDSYKADFIEELKAELKNCNLVVIDSTNKASDYTIIISTLKFQESMSTETINDTASQDNGKVFNLNDCSVGAETTLYNQNSEKIDSWFLYDNSKESLTNNRSFWDYLFRTNKDMHNYRKKELSSNVFENISRKCARNTSSKISKKISKQ